ncbi:MAG: Bro-N domain-containing protein, partial [Treponema sp.]|nr:Bro-N domain-containing protein [Treponema sp.]
MDKSKMQIFAYDEAMVRTVDVDGEPWFVGKDVATALEYTNPQKAVRDHVDDEDRTVNESFTVNGTAPVLINESGLYSLIFG